MTPYRPSLLSRRLLLAAISALVPLTGARAQQAPLAQRPALDPLPPSWSAAEVMDLWTGDAPNGPFQAQPAPADFPAVFFRNVERPTLRVFRPQTSNGCAVMVIPGGAYTFVVGTHEGTATAEALAALGYTAFVLIHRLPAEGWKAGWDVPLQDAQRALRLIRAHAGRLGYQADRVAVLGYSAGGHLAASLATAYGETVYAPRDEIDRQDARPSAVGLIYSVITLEIPHTNPQSALSLLGATPDPAVLQRRSPALHVTAETPPTFLVHALDDTAVPPENTLMMLSALRHAGVKAEAHLFQEGGHGFGLGPTNAPGGQWLALFNRWLSRVPEGGPNT
ncbi:hypothetical protein MMB232_02313 [Brevundimonas subvibrioides]|uniref:alpha/beta hydrolase n=1 Tax=Brevundimonas subvibrioides TaxID=74313 RepID=UPI0032D5938E